MTTSKTGKDEVSKVDQTSDETPDETLTGTEITPVPGPDDGPGLSFPVFDRDRAERSFLEEQKNKFHRTLIEDSLPPATGTIDVAKFVQAQAAYIQAQTDFLQHRRHGGEANVLEEVTRYSYAQADFIAAQNEVLHNLGVI